ncbi:SAM-dependent methyltransferase [Saccharothrix syringae]|uniref:SAM-dependent methyltransferase n=2 Tax=Saccharothrix syringae TaxID=103733 RepID=A0A5Q0HG63_SACSY|nr:SAM-dependent methyltransferase [Saccharothrix syringae]
MDLAMSYLFPAALRAAAALGVADHLAAGPRPVAELAGAVGADPLNLHRALRLLATRGIFAEDDAGRFALTPAAELLRTDVPSSFRAAVLMLTDQSFWRPAGELDETVRTGTSQFDRLFGVPFFEHFARDPATAAVFHDGMASLSDPENPLVARALDLPPDATVVDVGGGHGGLLLDVLRTHPGVRGVLFDQPHVLRGHRLGELGADHRWEVVGGDFFTAAPPGDVVLLKRVLHDWDDEHCLRILRHCRRAVPDSGRVLVVEAVVPPGNDPDPGKVIDLLMMSSFTGRERTRAEFGALFARADLRLTRVLPTGTRMSVVEGVPAG